MIAVLPLYCWMRSFAVVEGGRIRDERGEGVISAAIAVLIVAGLGALMWVGFRMLSIPRIPMPIPTITRIAPSSIDASVSMRP